MIRFLLILSVWFGLPLSAWANDIVVSRAIVVAPPNPQAAAVAAYFTIENHGATTDQLTGVATPSAAMAMLHENKIVGDVIKMDMLNTLDIPAGHTVIMAPAQLHVMLMTPKAPYKLGDDVPFELNFAGAGKIQVMAKVVPLSAALKP